MLVTRTNKDEGIPSSFLLLLRCLHLATPASPCSCARSASSQASGELARPACSTSGLPRCWESCLGTTSSTSRSSSTGWSSNSSNSSNNNNNKTDNNRSRRETRIPWFLRRDSRLRRRQYHSRRHSRNSGAQRICRSPAIVMRGGMALRTSTREKSSRCGGFIRALHSGATRIP